MVIRALARLDYDPAELMSRARMERYRLVREALQEVRDRFLPAPQYSVRSAAREIAMAMRRRQRGTPADASKSSRIVSFLRETLGYLHDLPKEDRIRQVIE